MRNRMGGTWRHWERPRRAVRRVIRAATAALPRRARPVKVQVVGLGSFTLKSSDAGDDEPPLVEARP